MVCSDLYFKSIDVLHETEFFSVCHLFDILAILLFAILFFSHIIFQLHLTVLFICCFFICHLYVFYSFSFPRLYFLSPLLHGCFTNSLLNDSSVRWPLFTVTAHVTLRFCYTLYSITYSTVPTSTTLSSTLLCLPQPLCHLLSCIYLHHSVICSAVSLPNSFLSNLQAIFLVHFSQRTMIYTIQYMLEAFQNIHWQF